MIPVGHGPIAHSSLLLVGMRCVAWLTLGCPDWTTDIFLLPGFFYKLGVVCSCATWPAVSRPCSLRPSLRRPKNNFATTLEAGRRHDSLLTLFHDRSKASPPPAKEQTVHLRHQPVHKTGPWLTAATRPAAVLQASPVWQHNLPVLGCRPGTQVGLGFRTTRANSTADNFGQVGRAFLRTCKLHEAHPR